MSFSRDDEATLDQIYAAYAQAFGQSRDSARRNKNKGSALPREQDLYIIDRYVDRLSRPSVLKIDNSIRGFVSWFTGLSAIVIFIFFLLSAYHLPGTTDWWRVLIVLLFLGGGALLFGSVATFRRETTFNFGLRTITYARKMLVFSVKKNYQFTDWDTVEVENMTHFSSSSSGRTRRVTSYSVSLVNRVGDILMVYDSQDGIAVAYLGKKLARFTGYDFRIKK